DHDRHRDERHRERQRPSVEKDVAAREEHSPAGAAGGIRGDRMPLRQEPAEDQQRDARDDRDDGRRREHSRKEQRDRAEPGKEADTVYVVHRQSVFRYSMSASLSACERSVPYSCPRLPQERSVTSYGVATWRTSSQGIPCLAACAGVETKP